ncbi:MAG: HD domain-containing protein [Pseudomonadota bacterium]
MADKEADADGGVLAFLAASGALKDTMRSAFTDAGARENTAAHSWRLALWIVALEPELDGYDLARLLKMAIVHDLGEAITGDVPAIQQKGDQAQRKQAESAALRSLVASLPDTAQQAITEVAEAYDDGVESEAKLLKALDKLETLLQHATGENPADFDYTFNLTYGTDWTNALPLTASLRTRIDALTRQRLAGDSGKYVKKSLV